VSYVWQWTEAKLLERFEKFGLYWQRMRAHVRSWYLELLESCSETLSLRLFLFFRHSAQCKDTISYCDIYQAYCSHPQYKDSLEANCKNTCGFCEEGKSTRTERQNKSWPDDVNVELIWMWRRQKFIGITWRLILPVSHPLHLLFAMTQWPCRKVHCLPLETWNLAKAIGTLMNTSDNQINCRRTLQSSNIYQV